MKVPFLDLRAENAPLDEVLALAVARVVRSGQYVLGPEVEVFERALAKKLGVKHAVGVSSGTDALLACLMALDVGPGDEVITTTFSFFATVEAIIRLGATPVFVDIDPGTFNLNWNDACEKIGPHTKAILPVHLFGRSAGGMAGLPVPVVEDAAQAIGTLLSPASTASCLSFFPSKNLGGFGDGGAVLTDDEHFADKIKLLRQHGSRPKYVHATYGGNFRLDAIQAALLGVKLPHLDKWTQKRRSNATRYRSLFERYGAGYSVELPKHVTDHVYNQFVIRALRRDELREFLAISNVATEVYYPVPLHQQPVFRDKYALGDVGTFPEAERAAREVLALPIFPEITPEQQEYVVQKIGEFYGW